MSNRVICYRPEMNSVWGGTLPNLFVEQCKFWWEAMGRKPFYKFNDKPAKPNTFYREGDSWQEELSWSRTEFEGARDAVAVKANPGDNKRDLLKKHVIVYYRDSKNRLWYMFSEELYYQKFHQVFGIKQEPEEEPPAKDTPESEHSAFANADIRQPDNNRDDPPIVDNNKKVNPDGDGEIEVDEFGIPLNPITGNKEKEPERKEASWMKDVLPDEDELLPFGTPKQVKRLKLEWRELWEKNGFPPIYPMLRANLVNLISIVGEEIYKESIEIAVKRDVKTFAYVERVALNKLQEKLNADNNKQPGKSSEKASAPTGMLSGKYRNEVES